LPPLFSQPTNAPALIVTRRDSRLDYAGTSIQFGAGGETRAHGGIGLGYYAVVADTIDWEGPPNLNVEANFPGVGVIIWSPDKPLEPPHGVIGVGEGGFAGIGFRYYSPPIRCDCAKE